MASSLTDYLDALSVPKTVKADIWDAVNATDAVMAQQQLDKLPLSKTQRADLWDFRPAQAPVASAQAPGLIGGFSERVAPVVQGLLAVNKEAATVLQTALSGDVGGATKRAWSDLSGLWEKAGASRNESYREMQRRFQRRDYAGAALKLGEFADATGMIVTGVEGVVNDLNDAGHHMAGGEFSRGLGETLGTAALLMPEVPIRAVSSGARLAARGVRAVTPAARPASAVAQFAAREGIPLSLGQRTGNPVARIAEEANAQTSVAGSLVERNAAERQAQELARVRGEVADRISPTSVTPRQAGASIQDRLATLRDTAQADTEAAYNTIIARQEAEARRLAQSPVQAPPGATAAFTRVPFGVDLAAAQQRLQPVWKWLQSKHDAMGGLASGADVRAYQAMQDLMTGPQIRPLYEVDQAILSPLKDLTRHAKGERWLPDALSMQNALHDEVGLAARRAGPDIVDALRDGREAWKRKVALDDLLKDSNLGGEEVSVFDKLSRRRESGASVLEDVATKAPDEVRQAGRAKVEELFSKAMDGHADSALTAWKQMGDDFRRVSVGSGIADDVDRLFETMSMVAKRQNTSRTAYAVKLMELLSGGGLVTAIGLEPFHYALQKAMWSQGGAAAIRKAIMLPFGAPARAAAPVISALWDAVRPFVPAAGLGTAGYVPVAADGTTDTAPIPPDSRTR